VRVAAPPLSSILLGRLILAAPFHNITNHNNTDTIPPSVFCYSWHWNSTGAVRVVVPPPLSTPPGPPTLVAPCLSAGLRRATSAAPPYSLGAPPPTKRADSPARGLCWPKGAG